MKRVSSSRLIAVMALLAVGSIPAVQAMVVNENQQYCARVDAERALNTTRQLILEEMENRARVHSPFDKPESMQQFGVDEPARQQPVNVTAI